MKHTRRNSKSRKSSAAAALALGANNYGKSRVRMVKVTRKGKTHTVREFSVDIALTGDFEAIHCAGDNALCLPTDTMKNTVYALGKTHPIDSIESFATHLGNHFVQHNDQVSSARIKVAEVAWERVAVGKKRTPHPHCFSKGSDERAMCDVTVERSGTTVISGIDGLVILKSANSAFSGYPHDEFTTLPETRDRIFCTSVTARWMYAAPGSIDHNACRNTIRTALVETFAAHKSESVQQTLYAMGEAALAACPKAEMIRLSLPNKHCLLINLSPFGLTNKNEIFVPTDEPHGLIEATVERTTR